jgi:hypothetical protein
MFKITSGVAALVVAGLACTACTDVSSLKVGGGGGSGGQTGSSNNTGGQIASGSGGRGTGGLGDCICDAVHTGGTTGSSSTTGSSRMPDNHRQSDEQCRQAALAGNCNGSNPAIPIPMGMHQRQRCSDAGVNGRCISELGPAGCFCTYDSCVGDSDCPGGQTCACHGSPDLYGSGNRCVPGNCRVDTDCGTGRYCSPSPALPCAGGGLSYCLGLGYYCHTPQDQCVGDSDCARTGSTQFGCVYSAADGRWECLSYAVPL